MEKFDYVIVGAGSAGCVLANRLTRDPATRVLLLEAGGWDKDPMIALPVGIQPMTAKQAYRWNDMSEPDAGLNGRRNYVPHGKVIGGGSSINYMAHTRCHPSDYDNWAADGATGWSYKEVLPFFKECETWAGGGDEWRGEAGELGAIAGKLDDPVYDAWFGSCRALGYPITNDHNGEKPEGIGVLQYTIKNGQRSSAAKAFLHPVLSRPNLTVRTDAMASRLLFDGKRAIGVEYLTQGQRCTVHAAHTVLSLGAINTPQLLMLSGIGPAEHLSSMGIQPLIDLPVGKNLQDHLAFSVMWARKKTGTLHRSLRLDRALVNIFRALVFRSGPSSSLPGVILGFIKSRASLKKPDLQLYIQIPPPEADAWFPGWKKPYQDCLQVKVQLMASESRGEITLRSLDPNDRPRIFYNSLSAPADIQVMREGFKRACALLSTDEMKLYRGQRLLPDRALNDDAEIDAFIREQAFQQYHPAGTCRMGNDERAVVNPDLSVRGLEGLSVVDASVMPTLISGNPNVPIMMIAAKVAAMWTRGKE
nr:GMC family oxidoreductase N-terminal domain-containing protein [Pseudomonas lactucae]